MCAAIIAALLLLASAAAAQGVSTAGIRGNVNAEGRRHVDARVRISHDATGFSVEVRATGGRYLVQGLEAGGPYTVTARALGLVPQRTERVFLTLGELRDIDFVLPPLATRLDTVTVAAGRPAGRASDGGTGSVISEALLDRLPTLNRDLYDFVRLVPQISTKISLANPGLSAGGVGFRFNNFLINGVSERTLSGGVSNAFAGAKSIPLGAVQEYQVLLAPYDVRYGDFAGALVNAVTKSGTNTFHGSLFAYGRSDQIRRHGVGTTNAPYEKLQYGLSLGGPIVRNRLHFFVAPELQQFTYPADGPYVGQPPNATRPIPVSTADLARFDAIMRSYGLVAGSSRAIENGNPLRNLFTRFDLSLPEWNSRLIVWNNYSGSDNTAFSRFATDTFSLSSYQVTGVALARSSAVHLHTALGRAGGGHNELLVSHRSSSNNSHGAVEQPIVRVSVPSLSGGRLTLNTGTHETAQSTGFRSWVYALKDNVTLPLGASHVVTLGAEIERFRIYRAGVLGTFGSWSFASLDDFARGMADRYEIGIDVGNATRPLNGRQYTAYVGDQWRVTERLSLSGGVRADMLAFDDRAPYNPAIDSIFGRRTDQVPRRRVELSPRLGFVWNVSGTGLLRGGLGVFAGRYPLAWSHTALTSYGIGGGLLRCSLLSSADRYPPAFTPDHRASPTTCGGGYSLTASPRGDVDLLDRNLRMMRVARGSLAYERRLPGNVILTNEALLTRALSDFVFVNLNLLTPLATDPYERVMYGTIGANAVAAPTRRSDFAEVIDVRNTGRNQSYQLSTRLEKTHAAGMSSFLSYTYSRSRDVQTPLRVNTRGTVAWASARATGGRHDDLTSGISSNDVPHRLIVAGTYVAPWSRARSELSFYYVGESGRPFTYIAFGALGRGDLNADGSNANDPIYVPRNALDASEMRFSGISDSAGADNSAAAQANRERAQRNAFDEFVRRTSCLRRQRGQIMQRNSCREPWTNTMIASLRQTIPVGRRTVEVQLDVFNVLNLVNSGWGLRRDAAPALLEHVGQMAETAQTSRPVFRYDTIRRPWTTQPNESAFQLQLALRYRF